MRAYGASCDGSSFPPVCYYSQPHYYACGWAGPRLPLAQEIFPPLFYWTVKLGHGPTDPWGGGEKLNWPICMRDDVMTLAPAAGSV